MKEFISLRIQTAPYIRIHNLNTIPRWQERRKDLYTIYVFIMFFKQQVGKDVQILQSFR